MSSESAVENLPSEDLSRTREHHEAELVREKEALRAELDETYGLEIHRIKEHLTERHREEIDRLTRELTRSIDDARRASAQVTDLVRVHPKMEK